VLRFFRFLQVQREDRKQSTDYFKDGNEHPRAADAGSKSSRRLNYLPMQNRAGNYAYIRRWIRAGRKIRRAKRRVRNGREMLNKLSLDTTVRSHGAKLRSRIFTIPTRSNGLLPEVERLLNGYRRRARSDFRSDVRIRACGIAAKRALALRPVSFTTTIPSIAPGPRRSLLRRDSRSPRSRHRFARINVWPRFAAGSKFASRAVRRRSLRTEDIVAS